ncbi:hypothetical protein [Streptomyces griseochromogenes]|uniref:hypothetical protein n=1 Tax=Streptomyces griseochromogenes TaxID=68214 RepID=UPI0037963A98
MLRESQDFWDDRSVDVVEAAHREVEADLAVLAATLTSRWGNAETVDLWPYLGFDTTGTDFTASPPLDFLSGVADSMRMWRLPNSERWLALAIGQADPEWPIQLLVAVGEAPSLRY